MRCTPAALVGAALLSLAALAAPAHADPIQWYYSWSRTPNPIYADGSTTSYVSLSQTSQTKTPGASLIEAMNTFHYGGGPNGPPAVFSPGPSTLFALTLTVWDPTAAQPGQVTFDGNLFGYLTSTVSHIQSYYPKATTKSLTLGKDLYTITLDTFAPSGPDCTTAQVTAIAHVTVQPLPEPPSAVLAGLALPAVGLFWARRRWVGGSNRRQKKASRDRPGRGLIREAWSGVHSQSPGGGVSHAPAAAATLAQGRTCCQAPLIVVAGGTAGRVLRPLPL